MDVFLASLPDFQLNLANRLRSLLQSVSTGHQADASVNNGLFHLWQDSRGESLHLSLNEFYRAVEFTQVMGPGSLLK